MTHAPRSSWLRSKDPEKAADAVMLCRNPGAWCAAEGRCEYDNTCFPDDARALAERERKAEAAGWRAWCRCALGAIPSMPAAKIAVFYAPHITPPGAPLQGVS